MKIVTRSAIALLAMFYLATAYAVLHPRVSERYRAYYISHTDFISPWQHETLEPLAVGQDYGPADPRLLFDGWYLREDKQRWNTGHSARIVFRVDGAGPSAPRALTVCVAPFGAQHTVWRLNGREIAARQLTDAASLRLPLAAGVLRKGENELVVDMPDARVVGHGNPKMWALRFDSLGLE